jgi:hypothetical protein
MRMLISAAAFLAAATAAVPAAAQDGMGEIIVTAQRASADYFNGEQTVLGLRRPADSALQSVMITSDSRDEDVRKREIGAMMETALKRAAAAGVMLVTGDFELQEINLANYRDLPFGVGNRADTSTVSFYVKSKLAGSTGSAQGRIDSFIKGVAPSGRSLLEKQGALTLTIVNPDQYRDQIIKLIAAESLKYAAFFGADYGVEVSGLNEQLNWAQASGTEVFLYIPYQFSIRPK